MKVLFGSCNIIHACVCVCVCFQRSIPDEVARESKSDILVIALSYTFMFAYVAVSLGRISFSNPAILLVSAIGQ